MPRQNLVEQPHRAAVKVVARDDLVARAEEPRQRADGRHSAREGAARFGAFEPRDLPLDQRARRIAAASVIVLAELVRRGLAKGGRLIDRRGGRTVRIVIRINMHALRRWLHCLDPRKSLGNRTYRSYKSYFPGTIFHPFSA